MTRTPVHTSAFPDLSETEFRLFNRLIYDRSGIHLEVQKIPLVRARLLKRLRALGITSFKKYYDFLMQNDSGEEQVQLLNAISTNLTQFFRDAEHFDFLKTTFFPKWSKEARIRILSAGCSTGEEAYSIAMSAREFFGHAAQTKVRIDAGDISTRVLDQALKGVYRAANLKAVSRERLQDFFLQGTGAYNGLVAVAPEVKSMVEFRYLNLMKPLAADVHYHAIFCRNVAIYFDRATQQAVFQRLSTGLVEGGTLFLGQSESMASSSGTFKYVQAAVYENRK